MKKNTIYRFLFFLCSVLLLSLQHVHSEETTQSLEAQLTQLIQSFATQRQKIIHIDEKIQQLESKINANSNRINYLQSVIEKRKEVSLKRLVAIQLGQDFDDVLMFLMSSENVVDFINRVVTLNQLQTAVNEELLLAQHTIVEINEKSSENENYRLTLISEKERLTAELNDIEQQRIVLNRLIVENEAVAKKVFDDLEKQATNSNDNNQNVVMQTSINAQIVDTVKTENKIETEQKRSDELPIQSSLTSAESSQIKTETAEQTTTVRETQIVTTSVNPPTTQEQYVSISDFKRRGVVYYNGYKFTYYSELVLPGGGLNIPGRHLNASGYVVDGDGYIVLANDAPRGTIFQTPFGGPGKVYDRGTYGNHIDVYLR